MFLHNFCIIIMKTLLLNITRQIEYLFSGSQVHNLNSTFIQFSCKFGLNLTNLIPDSYYIHPKYKNLLLDNVTNRIVKQKPRNLRH